jgi:hypothetical protein
MLAQAGKYEEPHCVGCGHYGPEADYEQRLPQETSAAQQPKRYRFAIESYSSDSHDVHGLVTAITIAPHTQLNKTLDRLLHTSYDTIYTN